MVYGLFIYCWMFDYRYVPTDHDAENKEEETESGFLSLAHAAINGGISGVFDKFLGSYVLLERQNLEDMLKRLYEEEDTTSEGVGMSAGSNRYRIYRFRSASIGSHSDLHRPQLILCLNTRHGVCMCVFVYLCLCAQHWVR